MHRTGRSDSAAGMERLDCAAPIPAHLRGGVVALGNFDGFHRGHQAVVGRAVARARAEGRAALVATFDPHPTRFFRPDSPPFLLTAIDQRVRLCGEAGADAVVVIRFDRALAQATPEAFVAEWLGHRIGAAAVVTGENFSFGQNRAGDIRLLAECGAAHGIAAEAVGAVMDGALPVSSSRARAALRDGDMAAATRLLTRPFAIEGIVQHGDKRGRTIGYPTANLDIGDYLRPAYGIYAVTAETGDGRRLQGAANLGIRPSFDPPKELLEPHFFDFSGDLYGARLTVSLVERLRPEARFDSLEALTVQMAEDCAAARAILAARPALA